jgi:hypothetical protein
MKYVVKANVLRAILALTFVVALMGGAPTPTHAANVSITLVNPPAGGILYLGVGESYTFEIVVTSDEAFNFAMALPDQFYPGRGIFFNGNDRVNNATSAVLHLTVTGKEPTLGATNIPDGIAPAAVVVGVRFKGGVTTMQRFDFGVIVQ